MSEHIFTAPTSENGFTLSLWNELRLAYDERRQAVHSWAEHEEYDVGDQHGFLDVRRMQTWIESQFDKFVDHDATFDGAAQDAWPDNYTWTEFLAKAGLNYVGSEENAWRRQDDLTDAEAGTFLYGKAEVGDICGPWIIQDLQKALSAMRYRQLNRTHAYSSLLREGGHEYAHSSWGDAKAEAVANYDLFTPIDSTYETVYGGLDRLVTEHYYAWLRRTDHWTYKAHWSVAPFGADVLVYLCADGSGFHFWGSHGTGLEDGKWIKMGDTLHMTKGQADPSITVVTAAGIGAGSYPDWPPEPAYPDWAMRGFTITDRNLLYKWDFTKTTMPA